jgi:putative intracellular protease/amidase
MRLVPDVALGQLPAALDFDLVVVPGGLGGAEACAADERVVARLVRCHATGRKVAAICAGPLALHAAGLLEGRRFTCHPSVRDRFGDLTPVFDERVVIDEGIVTSQGPGTALEFSLALVDLVVSEAKAAELSQAMLAR